MKDQNENILLKPSETSKIYGEKDKDKDKDKEKKKKSKSKSKSKNKDSSEDKDISKDASIRKSRDNDKSKDKTNKDKSKEKIKKKKIKKEERHDDEKTSKVSHFKKNENVIDDENEINDMSFSEHTKIKKNKNDSKTNKTGAESKASVSYKFKVKSEKESSKKTNIKSNKLSEKTKKTEKSLKFTTEKVSDIILMDNKFKELEKKKAEKFRLLQEEMLRKKMSEISKEDELLKINNGRMNELEQSLYTNYEKKNEIINYIIKSGNFDTRNRDIPFYLILPNSNIKRLWQFIVFMFLMYFVFLIPIDIGWNFECITKDKGELLKKTILLCSLVFFIDIVLNFLSAYTNDRNQYVTDIKLIAQNYIKSNFIFDLLAVLPFNQLSTFNTDECFKPELHSSKLGMFINLILFNKVGNIVNIIETAFSRYINEVKLIKIFFIVIYLSHFFGHLFSGISIPLSELIFKECIERQFEFKNFQEMAECKFKELEKKGHLNFYFFNLLFGMYFITGNEYSSKTKAEKIMHLFLLILSLGLNASIFGNVAVVLSRMSVGLDPFIQEKVDVMKEYMNFMKFEPKFIRTIEEYHVNIWMKQRNMMYPEGFFSNLSVALQKLIFLKQWKINFFNQSKLLGGISVDFFSDLLPKLKPKIFMKFDNIITEGQSDSTFYLMSRNGICSIKIGGEWIKNMTCGEFFGEISIILRSKRRTASVINEKDNDFLALEGADFEKMLQDYPEDYNYLKIKAKERLMDNIKITPSKLWAKLVPKNELKDYLIRKCIYLEDEDEDKFYGDAIEDKKIIDEEMVKSRLGECSEVLNNARMNLIYISKLKKITKEKKIKLSELTEEN
jgi:hypothetical protein